MKIKTKVRGGTFGDDVLDLPDTGGGGGGGVPPGRGCG